MIKHLSFNSDGLPSSGFTEGGSLVFTSRGAGTTVGNSSAGITHNLGAVPPDKIEEGTARDWVPWGQTDDFPRLMYKEIRKSGVARSALQLLTYKLYGQQVVPVIEEGVDENLQMKYSVVKDLEVKEFLMRSNIDSWRLRVIQDYNMVANAFPMLLMNDKRDKVVKLGHDKAHKFRYEPYNRDSGRIENVFRSANFPAPATDEIEKIPVIDSFNWYEEVDRIKYSHEGFRYVFPTYYPDFLNDYYSLVYWDGVRSNGWLEISNSIPAYKRAIFKNQTTIKYHVKIPYSYWLKQYPKFLSMSEKERTVIVNAKLDEMDDYLTGSENAMKTFISFFEVNKNTGKSEDKWEIEVLDDKVKGDAYLPDSSAANAEILFSMLVNPSLFGVGMPGGSYTGGSNNGGSNIRESWLVMNAMNNADRHTLYQVFDFVKIYNGWNPDMKLITLDKVLTTTDTGQGSKIVS